ncbi:flagellar hook-length control protein FliK [Comamonadaceae bacterium M7527]|nr:flagellar hook-length control protein FliK [Comamonadaceae bacterium M7527]
MPQPTAAQTLNASYLEASKALARTDATAPASAWSSPSQDFGQLFARVHAASNGQQFAAAAAQASVTGMGSSANMDLSRFDSAASWQGPKYEPQDSRQSPAHQDRRDHQDRQHRQVDSRFDQRTAAADTHQPSGPAQQGQTKAVTSASESPAALEDPASTTKEAWQTLAQQVAQALKDAAQAEPGSDEPPSDIMAVALAGGMQIITPTQVPNEASLAAFAKAQGMSPEAVAMLLNQAAGQGTQGGGLMGQTTAQWMTPGAAAPMQADAALQVAIAAMGQGEAGDVPELSVEALKQHLQAQAQPTQSAPPTAALTNAIGGQALALAQQQAALLGGLDGKPIAGGGASPLSAQVAAQMLVSGLNAQAGGAVAAPGANTSTALAAQAMALAGVSEDDIQSLLGARGAAGANVLGSEPTLGGLDKLAAAVPRAAQPLGVVLGAPGAAIAQRTEMYQNIANRLGEAMGALAGQIAKGQWSMQLTLKPANLGAVDVDLSMRNGELEAKFTSANPLTRDLLQDSLPKLREALSQAGTNIASMDVHGESGQKNNGNPTPQQGANTRLGGEQAATDTVGDGSSLLPAGSASAFDGDGPLNVWA